MNELYSFLLFIVLLFLYIHIADQYKTGEDLEIYEMDYSTNTHLQTVCDVKQPVLFDYQSICPEFFENIALRGAADIQVKESNDYWNTEDPVESISLPAESAVSLLSTDTRSQYISENNESYLIESGIAGLYSVNDEYLKPHFVCQTKLDIMTGSKRANTPLRYHMDFRQFIIVQSGKMRVKMTPWKSRKYLYPIKDYENFDFRSPINVWNPQHKYLHEMDRVKFLEFEVVQGQVLVIPPYWWYSIQYTEPNTILSSITYRTFMNGLANTPEYILYFFQQQNTRTHVAKVLVLPEIKEDESDNSGTTEDKPVDVTPIQQSINLLTVK